MRKNRVIEQNRCYHLISRLSHAFEYEVCAVYHTADVVRTMCTKRFYQPNCHYNVKRLPEKFDAVIGFEELPSTPFTFVVTPMNSFGVRGRPLTLKYRQPEYRKPPEKRPSLKAAIAAALLSCTAFAAQPWGACGFQVAESSEDSANARCVRRVRAAYAEKGVTLSSPKGWGWWLKPIKTDILMIGKRLLPSKSGSYPLPGYRETLDSLAGSDGYAIMRDKEKPYYLYLFGARDAGTEAAVEDFLANGYTGDKIVRKSPARIDACRWVNKGRPVKRHGYTDAGGVGKITVLPPSCWIGDGRRRGCTFRAARDGKGEYLEVVQTADATNSFRIKTVAGAKWHFKKPICIPRYGAIVVEVESDAEWTGGGFCFVAPGWKGSSSAALSGGMEKPFRSWSHHRGGLIGCFHTGRDQKLALMVNPRLKMPAGFAAVTNSLSRAWAGLPGHEAGIVMMDLPANHTGRERRLKFRKICMIENVTDDVYLERSKAFDRKMADYKADYSDSSAYLEVPAKGRLPKPLTIASRSNAVAAVALPEGELSPCLVQAAAEFVRYVKMICSVELPVVRGKRGAAVMLGFGRFDASKGRDGYRLTYRDGSIHVDGGTDKGVMNGVFALLENNTDIIWAHPDEKTGTIFTPLPGELVFRWGDGVESIPVTPGRGWNGYMFTEWMAHNKCNVYNCGGGGDITWMNPKKTRYGVLYTRHLGGHNIFHFMDGAPAGSPAGYYACNEAGERTGGNPCFSSEKLFTLFRKNLLSTLRYAPDDTDEIYVNLQDTWKSCLCASCRSPIVFPDGTRVEPTDENFFSTRYFMFMNRMAEEVRREFPGKRITTLAYFGSLPAPSCEIHPNLTVEYAPYPRGNDKKPLYHPDNRLLMQHLDDWYGLVGPGRLEVYGYHGLGLRFPRPVSEVMQEDFKVLSERALYVSSEYSERNSRDIWDYSSMEYWVMTHLMWNPQRSVEKLRKYYLRRTFREAAPAMERFYGTIREEFYRQRRGSGIGCTLAGGSSTWIVSPGHTDTLRAALAEAEKRAKHPKSLALIGRIRELFEKGVAGAVKSAKNKK